MVHLHKSSYWKKDSGQHDILKALDSDHVCDMHFSQAARKRFKGLTRDCSIVITDVDLETITSVTGGGISVQESNPGATTSSEEASQSSSQAAAALAESSSSKERTQPLVRRKLAENMTDERHKKVYIEEVEQYLNNIASVTLGSSYKVSIRHKHNQI